MNIPTKGDLIGYKLKRTIEQTKRDSLKFGTTQFSDGESVQWKY